jgi:threonyl-tRNA synthetase
MGILIENYKGAFPFWMAATQVGIVPIREEHNEYAKEIENMLMDMGIRVVCDCDDKNMNAKVKEFRLHKVPYIVVVGDKEVEERTVSITVRGSKKQLHGVPLARLGEMVRTMNEEHSQELIAE